MPAPDPDLPVVFGRTALKNRPLYLLAQNPVTNLDTKPFSDSLVGQRKMKLSTILCLVATALITSACAFHPQKGAYIPSDAPGWIRTQLSGNGGAVTFESPLKELRDLHVSFSTSEKGFLYTAVHASVEGLKTPVVFLSPKVLVVFKNSGRKLECDADEMTYVGRALNIPIGDEKEFMVTIPAFRFRDRTLPELKAEFIWSDQTYWYIRALQ